MYIYIYIYIYIHNYLYLKGRSLRAFSKTTNEQATPPPHDPLKNHCFFLKLNPRKSGLWHLFPISLLTLSLLTLLDSNFLVNPLRA